MNKTLIENEAEYRQHAFKVLKEGAIDSALLEEALGIVMTHECWDVDEDGNDVDEDGNLIPDDSSSPEKLVFEEWVGQLSFPLVMVSWFENTFDRCGDSTTCIADFVELKDFRRHHDQETAGGGCGTGSHSHQGEAERVL